MRELEPRFGALLPLDLEVLPDQLLWKSQTVLHPNDTSDLPARLYRVGIRRLMFGEGLDLEELTRFLCAIATRMEPGDPGRDYVTLLWEADLQNVRFVATDPYLDLEVPDEVLEGDSTPALQFPAEESQATGAVPVPDEEAFQISTVDEVYIRGEIQKFEDNPAWSSFIGSLVENLTRPQRHDRAEEITRLLERSFERLLIEERFDDAARVLVGMRGSLPLEAQYPVRQSLERMAHPDRLALIATALERGTCQEDQAEALFLGFGDWAAESLSALLSRSKGEHLKRFYVDMLVKVGSGALEPVMAHLLHAARANHRYFARVLGRLKDENAKEALVSCLDSDNAALRVEAIDGLMLQVDDDIRPRLWSLALDDQDSSVRIAALAGMIEDRKEFDCARIIERLESADLKQIGDEEKDLLFKALGAGGGLPAIGFLSNTLRGKWMPGRSELDTWRRAAMALATMNSPEALQVLNTHADGRGKLASVCQDALRYTPVGTR
ncbi:MAG: HEAT repeat domain-containing protein [bacterium]|nr:HEAT repeat domain-containing protein [bacterium]